MTDLEALFAAIQNNLEDDTLRLAYADELQANGDEDRAELIRVQVASPGMMCLTPVEYADNRPCFRCRPRNKKGCFPWCRLCELFDDHPEWKQHKCPDCEGNLREFPSQSGVGIFRACSTCIHTGDLLQGYRGTTLHPGPPAPTQNLSRKPLFRRGFIDSVECTLAELGEELRCSQPTMRAGECVNCFGRVCAFIPSPWAKAIVTEFPVTRFVLTDKTPWHEADNETHWRFLAEGVDGHEPEHVLPEWLLDLWGGTKVPYRLSCRTAPEAMDVIALCLGQVVRESVYGNKEKAQ